MRENSAHIWSLLCLKSGRCMLVTVDCVSRRWIRISKPLFWGSYCEQSTIPHSLEQTRRKDLDLERYTTGDAPPHQHLLAGIHFYLKQYWCCIYHRIECAPFSTMCLAILLCNFLSYLLVIMAAVCGEEQDIDYSSELGMIGNMWRYCDVETEQSGRKFLLMRGYV